MDCRSWAANPADRSDYLLDLMKQNDNSITTDIAKKIEEIYTLKKKLKELKRTVAAYEGLDLTLQQKALLNVAKEKITVCDDDGDDNDGPSTANYVNEDQQIYQPRLDDVPIAQLKEQINLLQNENDRLIRTLEEASNTHKTDIDLLNLENEKLRLDLNDLKCEYDNLDIQYHQARSKQELMQIKIYELYGLEDELKRLRRDNLDKRNLLAAQAININAFTDECNKLKFKCIDLRNECLYLKDKAEKDNATSKKELEALKATIAKQKCIISYSVAEIKRLKEKRKTESGQTNNLIAELALKEKQLLENDKQLKELVKLKRVIYILKGLLESADLEKKHLFSKIKYKDKMLKNAETRFNSVEDEMRAELESEKAANDNLKSQGADLLKQIKGVNRLRQKSEENANLFKNQNIDMRVRLSKLLDQISLLKDKEQSEAKSEEKQNKFLLQRIEELVNKNMEFRKQLKEFLETAPSPEILDRLKEVVDTYKAFAQLASTLPDEARRRLEEKNAEAERLRKEREELQQRVLDKEKQISEREMRGKMQSNTRRIKMKGDSEKNLNYYTIQEKKHAC